MATEGRPIDVFLRNTSRGLTPLLEAETNFSVVHCNTRTWCKKSFDCVKKRVCNKVCFSIMQNGNSTPDDLI